MNMHDIITNHITSQGVKNMNPSPCQKQDCAMKGRELSINSLLALLDSDYPLANVDIYAQEKTIRIGITCDYHGRFLTKRNWYNKRFYIEECFFYNRLDFEEALINLSNDGDHIIISGIFNKVHNVGNEDRTCDDIIVRYGEIVQISGVLWLSIAVGFILIFWWQNRSRMSTGIVIVLIFFGIIGALGVCFILLTLPGIYDITVNGEMITFSRLFIKKHILFYRIAYYKTHKNRFVFYDEAEIKLFTLRVGMGGWNEFMEMIQQKEIRDG